MQLATFQSQNAIAGRRKPWVVCGDNRGQALFGVHVT
jgi:hypothetical protein